MFFFKTMLNELLLSSVQLLIYIWGSEVIDTLPVSLLNNRTITESTDGGIQGAKHYGTPTRPVD